MAWIEVRKNSYATGISFYTCSKYKYFCIIKWVISMTRSAPGWGLLSQFSRSVILPNFGFCRNTAYPKNITFIFHRCQCNWAVATPVKYESDLNNLTGIFAKSTSLAEKLTKVALVNSTTGSKRWLMKPMSNMTYNDWRKASHFTDHSIICSKAYQVFHWRTKCGQMTHKLIKWPPKLKQGVIFLSLLMFIRLFQS